MRTPDPIIRDDSRAIEASLSFGMTDVAAVSELATILPTTTTSSWHMVIGGDIIWTGGKYLCHRGWVAKFLELVVQADHLGHIIDPFVQNLVNEI